VHPASIPVERPGRRVKTDRIDPRLRRGRPGHALRTFLAWLRGEPRVCSMVRIPSQTEEEMRRPGRERERLVCERLQLESRIENLLCLYGIAGFRPRVKKAAERLEALRSFAGTPLPAKTMAELRRLMARHRLLCEQLQEIEAKRDRVARVAHPDPAKRMIEHLAQIVGLGLETATLLVREMFCRLFRDRRAVAGFAGLTGTRTGGAKGRIRTVMIVALARKLLVSPCSGPGAGLWRYVGTGEVPAGARPAAA
jgi:transposase